MSDTYLFIYAGLTLGLVVGAIIRGFLFCTVIAKKSQSFHNGIFNVNIYIKYIIILY